MGFRAYRMVIAFSTAISLCGAGQQQVVTRTDQATPPKPAMDNSDDVLLGGKPGQATPNLHAAGVRGSIDSGGYSAARTVRAQSALMMSVLQLQIDSLGAVYRPAVTQPCKAEPSIAEAVEVQPEDFDANYRAADFYLQHADTPKALIYLKKAHALNSSDLRTVRLLAIADLQSQRPEDVLDLLSDARRWNENAELRELTGIAEEGLGNFESAAEQFRLATQSVAKEQNLIAWGTALVLLGNADHAGSIFRQGIAQYPRSGALKVGMAALQYDSGRGREALETLLGAAEMDPRFPAPYIFIARIMNASGAEQFPELEDRLRRLVKLVPDEPQAMFAYACSLWNKEGTSLDKAQPDEVESLLKRAVAMDPSFAEGRLKLAGFYAERRQYGSAIDEYRKVAEAEPDLAEAHYRLGQVYMQTGQQEIAKHELAQYQRLHTQQNGSQEPEGADVRKLISIAFRQTVVPGSGCSAPQ